jgi:MYXO-CTERM domain-containing protein
MRTPLFLVLLTASTATAAPQQIHQSWQGPTDSTITIAWRSTTAGGTVEYGASTGYGKSVTAKSVAYGGSTLHIAELTGLTPGTAYHYRCGSSGDWSADQTFATAPKAGTPFRFAAYGDSRSDDTIRGQVMAAVKAVKPAFSIHDGDFVTDGNDQTLWDEWFGTMQPLLSITPLMGVLGNHENNSPKFFSQLAFPVHTPTTASYPDEAYFSFDYGDTHFIGLCTEPVGSIGGPQYLWLKADLAAAAARSHIRWTVAFAHRPPYSSSSHGSDLTVRDTWGHLFESFGVDVTFWGHDHNYERTKPMFQGQPVTEGGVVYVVAGASGAPLYASGTSPFTAFSKSVQHFVDVSVDPSQLKLEARDTTGAVFDSTTIAKPAPKSPWILDGKLDAAAQKVASGTPALSSLYAGFDGRYLYVATEGKIVPGDHFILVAPSKPTDLRVSPWKKAGQVWRYTIQLAMESSNGWSGWQDGVTGQNDPASTRASNPADAVMEGAIDLVGKYGTVPKSVFLAAAAYGSADAGKLLGQVPVGDANGDIDLGEWYELPLTPPTPDGQRDLGPPRDSSAADGPRGDRPIGDGTLDAIAGDRGAEAGCGCHLTSPRQAPWAVLLGLGLLVLRRRRPRAG